jgi:hypothetical protein
MEFNGAIDWFHPSGSFIIRPSVTGPDGSISGIALRQENYLIENSEILDVSAAITNTFLKRESVLTSTIPVPVTRNVILNPKVSVRSFHVHGTSPSEWILRLYKNEVVSASGWFRWHPSANGSVVSWVPWLTDGEPSNIIFTTSSDIDTSDVWSMSIDNDGSGTAIDTIVLRAEIGFSIIDNYPDI